jgi:hypothetical protein
MRTTVRLFFVLLTVLVLILPAPAADLAKIDRTLAKEPAYQKTPQYCLLVFGHEARTRIWLVRDGDHLYIDRNGNGDLTEPQERVHFSQSYPAGVPQYHDHREARVAELRDGQLKHTDLRVTQYRVRRDFIPQSPDEEALKAAVANDPEAVVYNLSLSVEVRPKPGDKVQIVGRILQYAGTDANGYLRFADRPQDAPIIHFGGPLQMGLLCKQVLPRGDKPGDLMTMIGTPGMGNGTFTSIAYGGLIADDVHPVAELEFAPKTSNQEPIRARVVLKHRC